MAGLIEAGLFTGLGNAMSTYGLGTLQARERADLERDRIRMQAAARAEERALDREFRADQAAQDRETRLEIAGQRGDGRGKSGGMVGGVLTPEQRAALQLGDTVPEGQAWMKAITTGDTTDIRERIGREVPLPGPTEDGKQLTGKELPDDFAQILKDKRKTLAELDDQFRHGKDYKEITEGRRTELGNEIGRGLVAGRLKTEDAGEKISALEGKYVDPETQALKNAKLKAEADRAAEDAKLKGRTDPNLRATSSAAAAADKSITEQIKGITSRIGSLRQQQAKAEAEAMGERGKSNVRNSYAGQISALEAERATLQATLARGGKGADNARPTGAIKPGETRAYGTSKVTRLN